MVQGIEIEPADRDERLGEAVESYPGTARAWSGTRAGGLRRSVPGPRGRSARGVAGTVAGAGAGRLVGRRRARRRRLPAGRRLAGYRIVGELGSGGMGVVYEAVHVDLDRPVALKVLDARATREGSNGLRRFLNEARTAAALHHTNIVPVFDVGHVGGLCYYAMQRIEGSGLDRVIVTLRRDRPTGAGSGSGRRTPPPRPAAGPASVAALSGTGRTDVG